MPSIRTSPWRSTSATRRIIPTATTANTARRSWAAGPIICRGPNINPKIYERLLQAAKRLKIPYQLEADPRPTGTDARAIQMGRGGVATGLVSVPLRYMHTPSEVVDLEDVERCVQLFVAFALSLEKGDYAHW